MSDVEKYIAKRKAESEYFAKNFEAGYQNFLNGKAIPMTYQTFSINELGNKSLEEVLLSVLADQKVLAVQLSNGAEVVIQPRPRLKPLPILEGYVPEGWKDDIYNDAK